MRMAPLLLLGCYASADLGTDRGDAALGVDAALGTDADPGMDGPAMDVLEHEATSDLLFPVPAASLRGARWNDEMTLAVAFERRAEMPIELWNIRDVHADIRDGAYSLVGTAGSSVAAASRWGDLVAVALDKPEGPHEVVVADIAERRIVTRIAPDPTLMRDRVLHAFVALAERELLVIWLDPESVQRYRVVSFDGPLRDLSAGLAATNNLSGAVRLAARDDHVSSILRRRIGSAFDTVEERLDRDWVADGDSVAAFDRGALHIDSERVEEPRPVRTIYGHVSYARRSHWGVVALTTGDGLLAATIGPFSAVEWHEVESRWPAGSAVGHVYGRNRGFFVVEGAIGFQPSRLRWVALEGA